ncbi:OmpP1/FadL family transporter [Hymenobacter pini]|uniref:OmpP1/FadL family transporter n=1 Tax=Hymenobacter pini TaxID=2880879 RepID=UPI001CF2D777|nr:outer membrane protein transport protein [Hymenobacter pini]MCA8831314.1 outer membrane protein transport protein [Hymenobacter pini]
MTRRFLSVGFLFVSSAALAGGFQNGPQGARLVGLGGAATAYARDASAIFYNPGILGHLDSLTHLSFGGLGTARTTSFLGTDSRRQTVQDLAILPGGYFYASHPIADRVKVGLSINTPFGYDTQWPRQWEGSSLVRSASLHTVFVQPTAAFKINDNFSLGAGFIYAYGNLKRERGLGQYDDLGATARYQASGSGIGYSLGMYGRTGDDLSFGISFRGPVSLKMDNGKAEYQNVPMLDAARYPASNFTTRVKLPSTLSVGLADQMTKKLLVTFDFALTGWSSYDSLNFKTETGPQVRQGRRYEDAMSFRVGSEYAVSNDLQVRAGVSYDETPIRDEFISPELPDGNRLGGSLGVSLRLSRVMLDLGYGLDVAGKRTARVNRTQYQSPNIAGNYRTLVHTLAAGVSYSFGSKK